MCTSSAHPHDPPPPRRRVLRLLVLVVLALCTIATPAGPAAASTREPARAQQELPPGQRDFTVTPYSEGNLDGVSSRSAITLEVAPGQTISDRVSVFNFTDHPITFSVFAADAISTAGTGAFSLQLPDGKTGKMPEATDVGTWVTVPVSGFTAEPGTRTDVPITITVPLDAEPGDHAGGVVAIDTTAQAGSGDLSVDVKHAVGARIYARVEGPLDPGLTASDVHVSTGGQALLGPVTGPSDVTARFTITNSGNVRLTPKVTVKVKDLFGRHVASVTVDHLQEILPGASVDASAALGDISGIGPRYTVEVLAAADDVRESSSTTFLVVPWLLIVAALITIVVIRWRRRSRPVAGDPQDFGDPGPERGPTASAATRGDLIGSGDRALASRSSG